ncbi:MAG: Nuclease SbcCD, D subunit [Candidatus Daviesbacteria bacterium GW2011_GWA1_41_61]|uniref:Nuclease SbcCD subunit D n=1 Tax=Candidatus Daviesbacteria bacterium GW2011_GWA2_40_9 TaxID=1618424 RepID=A0A0G0WGK5_9BACT|nr:MAG: Nuclease SbcCD, D subunit [Candidatus Daviesbacteria bacterium GW2011_GWC1_40_9]KKR83430.1 MAG: Nuclease SbcCD, D subunit [Candidatus Daviesbacteria bacterium GW2011_GWA2_40_9]KKR93812.1 MAG: Nuclease SbcCD, D subunit [Candidatus Daviesbacteria bacterium GW2011_GWB1_41_15]KKS15278.1 MAG: Nuclease SbcCD, D subunit [Candidatus Daviesbacteria bacterium GW2011_GWA1_41_61]
MKLLHTADLHIGMTNYSKLDPETGLESRLLDFFKTLDLMVDYAIQKKLDAFIFAGDAYKTRDPSPTQQRGFGERIRKITKAGIPVVLVVGNHDTPNAEGKANTLDIYSALEMENVWVSRQPQFFNIPTKSGNLQVLTAPWLHKGEFKTLGDKLPAMYEKINPSTSSGPAILVGHLEVEGASFGSEKGLAIINDVAIPLSLLTNRKLSYVALGHIHKYQVLAKDPPVIYSGSPQRIDFGEEKEEKGFVIVNISTPAQTTYDFVPSDARKFLTIRVSLQEEEVEPTEIILKEIKKHDVENKVVRLIIDIPASVSKEISMDKIKKALDSAYFIAGISRNVERKERTILEGQEEVERLTPIEALQKYFESKKYSPEKIKQLEKYAASILEG